MKNVMSFVLVLSMIGSSFSIFAQPPFAFTRQEQREFLEQFLAEHYEAEDESQFSALADSLLNDGRREDMYNWAINHFGIKFNDAVNESLNSSLAREVSFSLDAPYTYVSFAEEHLLLPGILGAMTGAGFFGGLAAYLTVPILSLGGIPILGITALYGLAGAALGGDGARMRGRIPFRKINLAIPHRIQEAPYKAELHYRSPPLADSRPVKGSCHLIFSYQLEEDSLWTTHYEIRDCTHLDGLVAMGSFTIDENDVLQTFAEEFLEQESFNLRR